MRWGLIAVAMAACEATSNGDTNCLTPSPQCTPVPPDTGLPTEAQGPVAICTSDNFVVQPPHANARFDGSASYDPTDRAIVGYEWSLIQAPDGNAVPLSSRTGTDTALTPQLAGSYHVELTVMNDLSLRSDEPCSLVIDAVPGPAVHVELFWSHPNEDLDLHLVKAGAELFSHGDCYSPACRDGLEWGDLDVDVDNPTLVLDDADGVGPEIIQLPEPEVGVYTIVVHDNDGHVRVEPTDATVNIWWDGELVFNDTRRIDGEDSDTVFATLDSATGFVQDSP